MKARQLMLSAAVGLALLMAPQAGDAHQTRRAHRHENLHRNLDQRRDAISGRHREIHEWFNHRHEEFHRGVNAQSPRGAAKHAAFHERLASKHEARHDRLDAARDFLRDRHAGFHGRTASRRNLLANPLAPQFGGVPVYQYAEPTAPFPPAWGARFKHRGKHGKFHCD
jgi:hypothetical protein